MLRLLFRIAEIAERFFSAEREALKARTVDAMADCVSRSAAFVITVMLCGMGALLLAALVVVVLTEWTGSMTVALAIAGGTFVVSGLIVWGSRRRFMRRRSVRMFDELLSRRPKT